MANKRVLVKRRKSVRNIRKITRTMQLIATARFQSALKQAIAARPYTEKLSELVSDLSGEARSVEHRLMQAREDVQRSALVIITSNRGLCGGYNANVLRTAIGHIAEQETRGIETDIYMVGKKGVLYFRFLGRRVAERITHIGDRPKFADVEPIANMLMGRFEDGGIAAVHVAYMKFLSAGRQQSVVHRLLPLARESSEEGAPPGGASRADFEFSPEPKALLDELLPAAVRVQLFQCFTDAAVSEQIARMVAMKAATDSAGDMITALTRKYNRARQTQITLELLDIVGGANALA